MKIFRHASELQAGGRGVSVAIGMFDGVHLGHQKVLQQTIRDAREVGGIAVAVTFDKHPAVVLAPERAPRLIYPLPQKLKVMDQLGLDATWVIKFDQEFSRQPAELFVQKLLTDFGNVQSICVGANFNFGYKRSGNVQVLKALGAKHGFKVCGLTAVAHDGQTISSTRIRQKISEGFLDEASELMGRPYSVSGEVVRGDQLGRKIGSPTANVDVTGLVLPPFGVYTVNGIVDEQKIHGVANLGVRPTVSALGSVPRLEVHFPDRNFDLYGKTIEVEFAQKLRGEMKFDGVESLKSQISKDIAEAKRLREK
ncbi:MAG: bifunctional riboflavin kinase/FAD synthetase [Verrucomicrobiales bacterium]